MPLPVRSTGGGIFCGCFFAVDADQLPEPSHILTAKDAEEIQQQEEHRDKRQRQMQRICAPCGQHPGADGQRRRSKGDMKAGDDA